MASRIGKQLLRNTGIDHIGPELRVSYDVDKNVDRLRAVEHMRCLRSRVLQIHQARERNGPIGTINRLNLDRTGYIDDLFERLKARWLARRPVESTR